MDRRSAFKMGAALSAIAALSPESVIGGAEPNAEKDLGKVRITDVKTASKSLKKHGNISGRTSTLASTLNTETIYLMLSE